LSAYREERKKLFKQSIVIMNDTPNMAFKPVVLKTPKGYACFDYDEIVMFKADGRFSLLYTSSPTPPKNLS